MENEYIPIVFKEFKSVRIFSTIKESYIKQKDHIYFLCADWPARVCRNILTQKANYLENEAIAMDAHCYRSPMNIEMAEKLDYGTGEEKISAVENIRFENNQVFFDDMDNGQLYRSAQDCSQTYGVAS